MKTFAFGANFKIVGKTDPQKLSYAGAFSTIDGTLDDLAAHIGKGHPWMPALLDGNRKRLQSNANHAEILALDIDGGMTIEQALAHPFIKAHCGLGIESASSKPDHHKFRLVFKLENPLATAQTIKIANSGLAEQVGSADPACKDASRFFFGAPGRVPFLLNHDAVLPSSFMDESQTRKAESPKQAQPTKPQANQSVLKGSTSLAVVQHALSFIPPRLKGSGNYPECFQVLCGLVHEFGAEQALLLAESWSPSDCVDWDIEAKIAGLGTTDRPATIGSIFHIAKKHGFKLPKIEAKLETVQAEMNSLRIEPTITATGRYIPEGLLNLPTDPGLILIDGTMGVGKTSTALKGLIEQHRGRHLDGLEALIVPRNLLGIQSGAILGLPHHETTKQVDRVSLCLESITKLSPGKTPDGVPLIIFDEVSQTIKQLLDGQTYKGISQAEAFRCLLELLKMVKERGGHVVLSEDGLTNLELDFIQQASGLKVVEHLKFTKEVVAPRVFEIFDHKSLVASEIFDRLERGENVCFFSDSKKYAEELELECQKRKIERCFFVTSENSNTPETQAIANDPESFIQTHKPRLFCFTPSMQSGISIDDSTGHFDAMGFYLSHLEPRTAKQGVDRLRTDVPRFGFIKKTGNSQSEEFSGFDPEKIVQDLLTKNASVEKLIDFAHHCNTHDERFPGDNFTARGAAIDAALTDEASALNLYLKFWSLYKARENYAKKALNKNLISIWQEQGHNVVLIDQHKEAAMDEAFKTNREELNQEASITWAAADTSELFLDEARAILNDPASSPEQRLSARKRMMQDRLPGANLDDAEFVLKAVIQHNGRFLKSAELLWKAQNPDAAKALDLWNRSNALSQADQNIVILHKLSNHSAQAKLLNECPLQAFIEGAVQQFDNNTDEAIAVHQWALTHREDFRLHLRINISEEHTPVQTVNKLLKKLGLKVKKQSRKGSAGLQQWQYVITNLQDCDRDEILKALSERFLMRCEEKGESFIVPIRSSAESETSWDYDAKKWLTRESFDDVLTMWNQADSPEPRVEIKKPVLATAIA